MAKKPLEPKQEEQSLPVIVSFSIVKVSGGWVVMEIHTQGDKVVKVNTTEPNVRAIANESFRIKASTLMTQD